MLTLPRMEEMTPLLIMFGLNTLRPLVACNTDDAVAFWSCEPATMFNSPALDMVPWLIKLRMAINDRLRSVLAPANPLNPAAGNTDVITALVALKILLA